MSTVRLDSLINQEDSTVDYDTTQPVRHVRKPGFGISNPPQNGNQTNTKFSTAAHLTNFNNNTSLRSIQHPNAQFVKMNKT